LREEEIAPLLGMVRVHVSRSLRNLAERGVIGVTREAIRIPDLDALKEVSDGNARCGMTVDDMSPGESRPVTFVTDHSCRLWDAEHTNAWKGVRQMTTD